MDTTQNLDLFTMQRNTLKGLLTETTLRALYARIDELEYKVYSLAHRTVDELESELFIKKDEDGMKKLTLLSTARLLELAKMPDDGHTVYEYMLETHSEAQTHFDKAANVTGDFDAYNRFCDSVMTRDIAINFLCDTGRFRNI